MISSRETPRSSRTITVATPALSLPAVQCHSTALSRGTVSSRINFAYWERAYLPMAKELYISHIYSFASFGLCSRRATAPLSDSSSLVIPAVSESTTGIWWYSTPGISWSGCLFLSWFVRKSTTVLSICESRNRSSSDRLARWPQRIRRPLRIRRPSPVCIPPRSRMLCRLSNLSSVLGISDISFHFHFHIHLYHYLTGQTKQQSPDSPDKADERKIMLKITIIV